MSHRRSSNHRQLTIYSVYCNLSWPEDYRELMFEAHYDAAQLFSSDSNINIQMNYWSAKITNLDVSQSLFEYFLVNTMLRKNPPMLILIWDSDRKTGHPEGLTPLKSSTTQLEGGLSIMRYFRVFSSWTSCWNYSQMNVSSRSMWNILRWVKRCHQIFGHSGMKAGGNTAQWADYTGTSLKMMSYCR